MKKTDASKQFINSLKDGSKEIIDKFKDCFLDKQIRDNLQ